MCHTRNIPVLAFGESIKFSDKFQLDSVYYYELADSGDLIQDIGSKRPPQKKSFALLWAIYKTCDEEKAKVTNNLNNKNKQQNKKEIIIPMKRYPGRMQMNLFWKTGKILIIEYFWILCTI